MPHKDKDMANDLVKRLRSRAIVTRDGDGKYTECPDPHCQEAAARIEELEKALEDSPIAESSRSREYKQGYAAAWRAAVAWLHEQAAQFRDPDPRARAIANSLAFQLGNHRKEKGKIGIARAARAYKGE